VSFVIVIPAKAGIQLFKIIVMAGLDPAISLRRFAGQARE
jgi:hypothetical protein